MSKSCFSKRLRDLIDFLGMNQEEFSRHMGWPKSAVSMYLSGKREMKQDRMGELYEKHNIDPAWIMGFDVPMFATKSDMITNEQVFVPLYGNVSAGKGIIAYEDVQDYIGISSELARNGEYYALKIKGDSMQPRITDGDIVIIKKQSTAEDGDIVIALINGDDAVCKKYKRYPDGIMLISLNSAYEPLIFQKNEIKNIPVSIIGRVVELRSGL